MANKMPLPANLSSAVYITPTVFARMQAYIQCAPGEISGLGEVEPYGNKDFLVTDVFIFPQDTSTGHTEIDPDSLVEFLSEAVDQGRDLGRIHLWWHSHGDSNVFWSDTDEKTTGVFTNAGWMISIVGNRAGKFLTRIDSFNPRMSADRLKLILRGNLDAVHLDYDKISAEVLEKVTYSELVFQGGSNGKDHTSS